MPRKVGKDKAPAPDLNIPQHEWESFLTTFSRRHKGWLVRLETHDRVTNERVATSEMFLESIDYDLEDEKNPRINVVVRFDNKVVKHILFLPSYVVLSSSDDGKEQWLEVCTLNTETTVHLRPPVRRYS